MATVVLPRSLVALFPGAERRQEATAATVGEIIDELDERVPGLRDRLVDTGPALRRHINVYVDGRPAGLATAVRDDSVVHVIPAIAGGSDRGLGLPSGCDRARVREVSIES